MLYLNAAQQQRLEALATARDLGRIGASLARAFPETAARLGERRDALLQHAWPRARAHGLRHGLALARYLATWFVFGADFEQQPAHEWAKGLLERPGTEGGKAHQLGRLALEQLRGRAGQPGLPTPEAWEQALALLDKDLAELGAVGSLLPRLPLRLGQACDILAVRVELTRYAPRQHYVAQQGQWLRQPVQPEQPVLTLDAEQPLPEQLHLLSGPTAALPAEQPAGLRLRLRMAACCGPQVHPLITHTGGAGSSPPRDWRGQRALEWHQPQPGELPPPGIAVAASPIYNALSLDSCGLRDTGLAMGRQQTLLAVRPAAQHLAVWRREPGMELLLPGDVPPITGLPRARLERDGLALDPMRWMQGLAELDTKLEQALQQLLRAWERGNGLQDARLRAQPAVLAGSAGLSWGLHEAARSLQDPPWMRVQASADLLAWQLNLQLSGKLLLDGSRSLLTLECSGSERWQMDWQSTPGELKPPQLAFRQPLRLTQHPLAGEEGVLLNLAPREPTAPQPALAGSLGLRPRPDGAGLQWFVTVAIEAVKVRVQVGDPWLGRREQELTLLPATPLLDWSLS